MMVPGDPEELGGYWLAGRLGTGRRGVVYDSYDERGRRFAVTVPRGRRTPIRQVAHRHLAEVVEVRLDAPVPYVVSEFADGPDLRQAVTRHGPYSGADLLALATAVASALDALHTAGLAHRDLRPDKVLLSSGGPKVIGVGGPGAVGGTHTYLAPEVFTGQLAGAAADVFAWGALVLYAATGEDPFRGESLGEVMHRLLAADPDVSMLPAPLRDLVGRALAKDPADRPAARELLVEPAPELRPPDGPAGPRGLGEVAEEVYATLSLLQRHELPGLLLGLLDGPPDGSAAYDEHGTLARLTEAGLLVRRSVRVPSVQTEVGTLVAVSGDGVAPVSAALYRAWPRLRAWTTDERARRAGRPQAIPRTSSRRGTRHGTRRKPAYPGSGRWARVPLVAVLAASVALAVSVATIAVKGALEPGNGRGQTEAGALEPGDGRGQTEARTALSASLPEPGVFTDPAADFHASYRLSGDSLIRWAGGAVTHWDVPSRRRLATYPLPSGTTALSDDGRYAETFDGRRVAVSAGPPAAQATFTISNGDRTALYSHDRPVFEVTGGQVALSSDGRRAAVSGSDGRVELWDVSRRAISRTVHVAPGPDGDAPPLAFSPDGRLLALAGAHPALISDPTPDTKGGSDARKPATIPGPVTGADTEQPAVPSDAVSGPDAVQAVATDSPAFSPDSRLLALPSGDVVRLWRVGDRRLLSTLRLEAPGHDYNFSGDGRTLHYLNGNGSVVSLDVSATADAAAAEVDGPPREDPGRGAADVRRHGAVAQAS
ncbi:WD40 repeat domain-containing serine/threonine protein kinase [Nonomuraea sp. LPB2021202275-12-8]|uniref:WD40 repeat domain-containing serine/threonine protein kinase n=1 Tax=Nonomuraea sp. LPB2021202275-12-8 TaxID=3120159 RepID=UPI00300D1988